MTHAGVLHLSMKGKITAIILHSLQNMVVRFSCFLAFVFLTLWFEAIWLLCWDMRWWAREWNNTTLHLGFKPAQWWSNVACWSCLISVKLCFLSMVAVCLSTVGSQSVQLTWWVPLSFPFLLVLLAPMGFALCTFSLFSYLCLCRSKDWTTNIHPSPLNCHLLPILTTWACKGSAHLMYY